MSLGRTSRRALAEALVRAARPSADLLGLYAAALHDGGCLSLGQIARLCDVKRSTVARWIAGASAPTSRKARAGLVARARMDLGRPPVPPGEHAAMLKVAAKVATSLPEHAEVAEVVAAVADHYGIPRERMVGRDGSAVACAARRLVALVAERRGIPRRAVAGALRRSPAAVSRYVAGAFR